MLPSAFRPIIPCILLNASPITTCRSGDGSLICYYSLNNLVTDARYSGQLSEFCSLIASCLGG